MSITGTGELSLRRIGIETPSKLNSVLIQKTLQVYAYDLAKNTLTKGEVLNDEAINISIENILSTIRGERIFNPRFGTILPLVTFEQLNLDSANYLLDILIRAIKRFEKRVTVVEEEVELDILTEENAVILVIPYIINRNGLTSTFSRKVVI